MITQLKSHLLTGKKLLTLLLFVLMMGEMVGQNLVPNPSFENIINCNPPASIPWYNNGDIPPWDSPASVGSPDIFNTCMGNVPSSPWGYQNPRTGNGFVGAGFYSSSDGREYLQVELDSALVLQEWYCVSFYVNLGNASLIGINNIGIYFSNTHTNIIGAAPLSWGSTFYIPQINDTNKITDVNNWTLIYGQYHAIGGERYIIIGNFYDNISTDTVHINGSSPVAYYYIDDVNVHCCTCDSLSNYHASVTEINEAPELTLYPNPASEVLRISDSGFRITEVHIYSLLGECIYQSAITNPQSEINISKLPSGLYFAEIKTEKGVVRRKFVKQ